MERKRLAAKKCCPRPSFSFHFPPLGDGRSPFLPCNALKESKLQEKRPLCASFPALATAESVSNGILNTMISLNQIASRKIYSF